MSHGLVRSQPDRINDFLPEESDLSVYMEIESVTNCHYIAPATYYGIWFLSDRCLCTRTASWAELSSSCKQAMNSSYTVSA